MIEIINGHLKELFNKEEELFEKRVKICRNCKIYTNDPILGEVCSSKIYYNQEKDEISTYPKMNYINGCGCRINPKARLIDAKCPLNKWINI